jgi:hypothetical protein
VASLQRKVRAYFREPDHDSIEVQTEANKRRKLTLRAVIIILALACFSA